MFVGQNLLLTQHRGRVGLGLGLERGRIGQAERAQAGNHQMRKVLADATALLQPKAPSEFIGRIFVADVKVTKPRTDQRTGTEYGAGNTIAKYYKADGAPMAAPAAAAAKKTATPSWAAKAAA